MTAKRCESFASLVLALSIGACAQKTDPPRPAFVIPPPQAVAQAGTAGLPKPDVIMAGDNPGAPVISAPDPAAAPKRDFAEGQCAKKDIVTTRIVPTVWLVIDGSGSMVEMFGDKSRWNALREGLMDPMKGVVKSLEHDVKWGMIMYDGVLSIPIALPDGGTAMFSSPPATTCPRVISVEPAKDNFAAIDKVYPPDPLGGSTPTDKALMQVIQHLPNGAGAGPDVAVSPTIVVLATDGAPNDLCSMSFIPPDVRPAVIANVKQLAAAGNKTYVISLASESAMGTGGPGAGTAAELMAHLSDVAFAGGTGKPPFTPTNKDQLIQVFKDIIGPAAACDVKLNGKITPGNECKGGGLDINGTKLACNDDNGWKLKDASTITITGTACKMYQENATAVLHADFPCDIFMVN